MSSYTRENIEGVLRKWWDDATHTYHEYDEAGVEILVRDYNDDELLAASRRETLVIRADLTDVTKLTNRLSRLSAFESDAEIVAALARPNNTAPTTAELNRLLKVMLRRDAKQTATIALLVRLLQPELLSDVTDTTDV